MAGGYEGDDQCGDVDPKHERGHSKVALHKASVPETATGWGVQTEHVGSSVGLKLDLAADLFHVCRYEHCARLVRNPYEEITRDHFTGRQLGEV